jgi:hypothetical protein
MIIAHAAFTTLTTQHQLPTTPHPLHPTSPHPTPPHADEAAGEFFFNEGEVVAGLGPEERAAFLAQQVNFSVNIADEAQVGRRVLDAWCLHVPGLGLQ